MDSDSDTPTPDVADGDGGHLLPELAGPDDDTHPHLPLAVTLAVGIAGGLLLAALLEGIVARLESILISLLISLFLSFAMEPAVQFLARRGVRRGLGTAAVFLIILLLGVGFVFAMAPLVSSQLRTLVSEGPDLVQQLADRAAELPGGLGESVSGWLENARNELPQRLPGLAGGILGLAGGVVGGVLQALTVLLVTFYLTADGPRLRRTIVGRLEPQRQVEVLAVWELAVTKTGGYVYSRVLTAVISTVFHIIVFSMLGLSFATALGVYVGVVSSLIPVVGTYLAGALPLLIALADGPTTAVWVLVAIITYQQIENYLVSPRITEHTMSVHPAVSIVSVLAGGALLGPVGALLALPAAAIGAALVSAYGQRHELVTHQLLTEVDPRAGRRRPADEPA